MDHYNELDNNRFNPQSQYQTFIDYNESFKPYELHFGNQLLKLKNKDYNENEYVVFNNNDYKYDTVLSSQTKIKKWTYEIKGDLHSHVTENYAFEYSSYNKPSGIEITEADYFVTYHHFRFHIYLTKELRQFVNFHKDLYFNYYPNFQKYRKYVKVKKGGTGKNSELLLFNQRYFNQKIKPSAIIHNDDMDLITRDAKIIKELQKKYNKI